LLEDKAERDPPDPGEKNAPAGWLSRFPPRSPRLESMPPDPRSMIRPDVGGPCSDQGKEAWFYRSR